MVKVPFLPEFKERLLSGRKTATSRTKRLGRVGQRFTAFGATFAFTRVEKRPLHWVTAWNYTKEGFEHPTGFKAVWSRIHRTRGYVEEDEVYYHEFKRTDAERD